MGNLTVFVFYPCEISINLGLKRCLTLFLSVCYGQVIKSIVPMQNVGNHVIGFLCYDSFRQRQADRFDDVRKGIVGMDGRHGGNS